MPVLSESLRGRDVGHLRIVAELWGLELEEQEISLAILHLASLLLSASNVNGIVSSLATEAKKALDDLTHHAGRLPWAQFSRTYGEGREMGAAKRARGLQQDHPISAVEVLWYRALI